MKTYTWAEMCEGLLDGNEYVDKQGHIIAIASSVLKYWDEKDQKWRVLRVVRDDLESTYRLKKDVEGSC